MLSTVNLIAKEFRKVSKSWTQIIEWRIKTVRVISLNYPRSTCVSSLSTWLRGVVTQWVVIKVIVVSQWIPVSREFEPQQWPRCSIEQECLPLLLSTGWFQERIWAWFIQVKWLHAATVSCCLVQLYLIIFQKLSKSHKYKARFPTFMTILDIQNRTAFHDSLMMCWWDILEYFGIHSRLVVSLFTVLGWLLGYLQY